MPSRFMIVIVMLLGSSSVLFGQSDQFDDNVLGPQWTLVEDSPSTLNVIEQNQRVEVIANDPPSANIDAIYLSDVSFRMSTAADFELAIDYVYNTPTGIGSAGDAIGLVFGIGRDLDGTDSAAVTRGKGNTGFGLFSSNAVVWRVDDAQSTDFGVAGPGDSGTMVIRYESATDDLYLGFDGFSLFLLDDLVVGQWAADAVFISFGARGEGFVINSGEAYFDNFVVNDGTILIPEPATAGLLGIAALALLSRRHRRIL